ncbi:MAG: ParA family protein [Betaproteobacteria bacterium]|nr:MAG: ParA family protein [Betaproteobacteria bacterium]
MNTHIITIVNQKGGAGKTTLTMLLAGALADTHAKVLVADVDPQNSAVFWASRATHFPATVRDFSQEPERLEKRLMNRIGEYDFILIDCPPHASAPVTHSALALSHLALVPLNPSPLDLHASLGIRAVIDEARTTNPRLQARLVLNQAQPQTRMTRDLEVALTQFGIPLMKAQLHQRTAYRQCALHGHTIASKSFSSPIAAIEVAALKREVLQILKRAT